jgi:hypothetical protein
MKRMKHLLVLLLIVTVSLIDAKADSPTISVVSAGTVITKMPGSPTDFDLFTAPTDPNATDLTNFTVGLAGPDGGPLAGSGTITAPNNDAVNTAVYYQGNAGPTNLIKFTLNNTPDNFNFADFNVYVLIGNFGWTIDSMALAEGTDATGMSATSTPVTDTYEGTSAGQVVEFNITGASAGDVFTIATTSSINTEYIQGVSFESVPEPSTYALMLGSVVFLGICVRRKLA